MTVIQTEDSRREADPSLARGSAFGCRAFDGSHTRLAREGTGRGVVGLNTSRVNQALSLAGQIKPSGTAAREARAEKPGPARLGSRVDMDARIDRSARKNLLTRGGE